VENASEETHLNKNSLSISSEELDLLSVCPATHLKMFREKINTHKQNISGENLRLFNLKSLSIFGST